MISIIIFLCSTLVHKSQAANFKDTSGKCLLYMNASCKIKGKKYSKYKIKSKNYGFRTSKYKVQSTKYKVKSTKGQSSIDCNHRDISNRRGIRNFRLLVVQPLYTMTRSEILPGGIIIHRSVF